jgi:hypothetical protein
MGKKGAYSGFDPFGTAAAEVYGSAGFHELAQNLTAGAAGPHGNFRIRGGYGQGGEGTLAFGDCGNQGGTLGADGKAVGPVLHITTRMEGTVLREQGRAYPEAGIRGVGGKGGFSGFFVQGI